MLHQEAFVLEARPVDALAPRPVPFREMEEVALILHTVLYSLPIYPDVSGGPPFTLANNLGFPALNLKLNGAGAKVSSRELRRVVTL